jgi:hypothetical protein
MQDLNCGQLAFSEVHRLKILEHEMQDGSKTHPDRDQGHASRTCLASAKLPSNPFWGDFVLDA